MQNPTRLLVLAALAVSSIGLFTACAEERHDALERRQHGYDSRYNARTDRREVRSDHADERYGRRFDNW